MFLLLNEYLTFYFQFVSDFVFSIISGDTKSSMH